RVPNTCWMSTIVKPPASKFSARPVMIRTDRRRERNRATTAAISSPTATNPASNSSPTLRPSPALAHQHHQLLGGDEKQDDGLQHRGQAPVDVGHALDGEKAVLERA